MHRPRPRLTYANVVSTVALFAALGGGAYATVSRIPGSDGVIHGCYAKKGGDLHVVSASARCSRSEKALAFNQKGVQGSTGTQGIQGAQGMQGIQGERGIQGPVGPSQGFVGVTASGSFEDSDPDSTNFGSAMFTLAQSGRLAVFARGTVNVTCVMANSTVDGGLYVDGNGTVAGSGQVLATGNGAAAMFTDFGITSTLSAGQHTISYRTNCPIGTFMSGTLDGNDGAIGAILVGS